MLSIKSIRLGTTDPKRILTKQRREKYMSVNADEPTELTGKISMRKETFTLFVMISQAYMIDPRYQSSELSFRLCIGPNGYSTSNTTNISRGQTPIRFGPKMPCYLAFDKAKPCLSLQFECEDLRYFMYCKNFLTNSFKELVCLFDV